ncbi:MAG TPA: hypothetical protein PKJ42_05945, partial [Candidatus Goldiibacteriota bacterium]|nr:hypothetical protein [Candidatus Goldiibacteriota bacterium]
VVDEDFNIIESKRFEAFYSPRKTFADGKDKIISIGGIIVPDGYKIKNYIVDYSEEYKFLQFSLKTKTIEGMKMEESINSIIKHFDNYLIKVGSELFKINKYGKILWSGKLPESKYLLVTSRDKYNSSILEIECANDSYLQDTSFLKEAKGIVDESKYIDKISSENIINCFTFNKEIYIPVKDKILIYNTKTGNKRYYNGIGINNIFIKNNQIFVAFAKNNQIIVKEPENDEMSKYISKVTVRLFEAYEPEKTSVSEVITNPFNGETILYCYAEYIDGSPVSLPFIVILDKDFNFKKVIFGMKTTA